ncbi:MAG TPA: CHASE domain-containing protein [Rubrivivax sp.]|nr:CHASE domain-containing protein [Rubrivivax sp.]
MSEDSKAAWPWVLVAATLGYAAAGWLAVQLAFAPSYAAPLYPSAGMALAATLVYGRPALLATALGAFLVNVGLSAARGQVDLWALVVPLVIGAGAALQAACGAWLVRRHVEQPLTLGRPRDIWRFLVLAAPVACLVNASISSAALGLAGAVPPAALPFTWWTWWIGDSLGVLIAAPALLTLIGRPRSAWLPRRATVALPLLLVTALLVAATLAVARWDEQRLRSAFEREAAGAADAVAAWLDGPLQALQAVHGVFSLDERVSGEQMRSVTGWWLQQPLHLQAIGYSPRVARSELGRFEAAVRAEGPADFRVFDRSDRPAAATEEDAVVVRYIEPRQRNAGALGVNSMSVRASAEAIRRAQRSGRPSASAGFKLAQEGADQIGVVVYRALGGEGGAAAAPWRGVVFVALRMDEALNTLMAQRHTPLQWCLLDRDPAAVQRRLAGPPGCEDAPRLRWVHERALSFGGRDWLLRLEARPEMMTESQHANAWLFSVLGLASASLLGALLLIVTGRARRVEQEVQQRTQALREEAAQHQHTAEALRASEQQLQAILDSAHVGIVKTDLDGRILKLNPAYSRLLGYGGDELCRFTAGQLTHPEDRLEDARLLESMRRGQCDVYRREKRYLAKGGSVVHAQLTVALLRDAAGRPQFTVGVVEDIGEHLRLAEAERARESAESSNRAKSEFVSRMSHELRTPLNAMLGFAQLLALDRKPPLSAHQRGWAGQIQQAGWHLLHMINDTLDLSRIESGMLKLEPAALEVAPLVDAALAMVEPAAAKRGLRIEQQLDARRARVVLGDETRIKQILTNLLSNAVKYNVDGGSITLITRLAEGGAIEIVVSDTGLGMNRSQMDALFQPYNRLGRERTGVEGTGIGLVISRRLAELMGGSLRAQSTVGQGSSFVLTLPRAPGVGSDSGRDGEAPAELAGYRQRLVHYIEDNETNIEVMRGMLLRRPQVRLSVSMNGLDGLAAVRLQHPSLILLDMHLPDIDGLELLRHLKDDDALSSIPVVVVSADATAAHMEAALTAGAAHYVTKPVNLVSFLAVLDELLDDMDTHFG